ncbi:hypothetical protein B0T13DRAFT_429571 [Neurospora crassa]|nr:hypothetical protein B0T13DRAFT_429571 [Neurospora crassa]
MVALARFDALSQNTGDAWDFADGYNYDQIMLVWVPGLCTAPLLSFDTNREVAWQNMPNHVRYDLLVWVLGSALPVYDQIMLFAHFSRPCPKDSGSGEKICYKCQQPGHVQSQCPSA